jgi:hypothetical protein
MPLSSHTMLIPRSSISTLSSVHVAKLSPVPRPPSLMRATRQLFVLLMAPVVIADHVKIPSGKNNEGRRRHGDAGIV